MKLLLLILALSICLSCATKNRTVQNRSDEMIEPNMFANPPVLVYKTKGDYNNLVPILLSDDKKTILSYPHPNDLITGSTYQFPVVLNEGYVLDNRGIGANVAFLKMTYSEYANLKYAPSLQELYKNILDKDPLVELCHCGLRTSFYNVKKQLNELIDDKKIRVTCTVLK